MQKHAQKTKRDALFSETDRLFLKGKHDYSDKMKSKFYKYLDTRMSALEKDLQLMKQSELLLSWKSFRVLRYHNFGIYANEAFYNYQRVYVEKIKRVRRKISKPKTKFKNTYDDLQNFKKFTKKLVWCYWLNKGELDDHSISNNAFEKIHIFREKRMNQLEQNDKKILVNAYDKDILPDKEENAISLRTIKQILDGKTKPISKSLEKPISTEDVIAADSRNRDIIKIREKYWKILDKKLEKYDSKVNQLWLELHS